MRSELFEKGKVRWEAAGEWEHIPKTDQKACSCARPWCGILYGVIHSLSRTCIVCDVAFKCNRGKASIVAKLNYSQFCKQISPLFSLQMWTWAMFQVHMSGMQWVVSTILCPVSFLEGCQASRLVLVNYICDTCQELSTLLLMLSSCYRKYSKRVENSQCVFPLGMHTFFWVLA